MTPREVDIAYALEALTDVEALFGVAPASSPPQRGDESHVEVVVVVRTWSARIEAQVTACLAAAFDGEEAPRVTLMGADGKSKPRFMDRATPLVLSPSQRQDARARALVREAARNARRAAHAVDWLDGPGGVTPAMRARRACIVVAEAEPGEVARSLADFDADVRVVDVTVRAYSDIAAFEIGAGEVDLVLLDLALASTRGMRMFEAVRARFGSAARYHFFLTARSPRRPGEIALWLKYPHLTLPFDRRRFGIVLDNATMWRRRDVEPPQSSPPSSSSGEKTIG